MAENEGSSGRWRDGRGGGSDIDGRPGNAGDSPSYSRIYDSRSESETSNRLETSSQIRATQIAEQVRSEQSKAREAAREAQSRVHVFPSVGKFIIPVENTWAAHAQLIKDTSQNLFFNPKKFLYFDKIIADRLGMRALTDEQHPDHAKWEGLRKNLAVLRNDIIGMYLDDGSFDPGDEKHLPSIIGIAETIASGLKNDKWYKRPFLQHISVDMANVEAIGAREIYKHLLEIQTKPAGRLEGIRHRFNEMLGIPNRAWGMLPLEKTPFSDENLSAPPPAEKECFTPAELAKLREEDNLRIVDMCTNCVDTASGLQSIDTLKPPARETSVEEARKILRWLKNLQFTDQNIEEFVNHGTPAEQGAKMEALARLVEIYADQLHSATQRNPAFMADISVQDASQATGAIALGLASFTLNMLPDGDAGIARMEHALTHILPEWELREGQSTKRLLGMLETGLRRMSGIEVSDLSPAQRLLESHDHISNHAHRLRHVSELEHPTREESIELAREILRKMKNIRFSDMPIDELVRSGNPEDKAAFAQKIDEMVDIYKNLMFEAAQVNPGLLMNPAVKEANDAVGNFAHAIALMAAKEIPNSIAAAQQISADVTQDPEEWRDLHNRTVGRLVKSMEGGLEQAVADLATQQQEEQQQDEEIAQGIVEAALMQSDQMHRRRRRRRRRQQSGMGGAKQRKNTQAIEADDYVLKQGRFRDDSVPEARPARVRESAPEGPALRPEDLAAVKELGNTLRGIGQQAKEIPMTEPLAPDDRAVAARVTEQEATTRTSGRRENGSAGNRSSQRPRA